MKAEKPADLFEMALEGIRQVPTSERPPDSDVLALLASGTVPLAAHPVAHSRRRLIVRIATWSLAASVLLAIVGVLVLGGSSGVALADVLKAAEKHKLVKYKINEDVESTDGSAIGGNIYLAYADLRSPRLRSTLSYPGSFSGAFDFESVYVRDNTKARTMHIITETITEKGKTDPKLIQILKDLEKIGVPRKVATIGKGSEDQTPATRNEAKSILENFRELESHKEAVATKGELNGKAVLKYRIEEGKKTTTLLVDQSTKLPVRVEYETTENLTPPIRLVKYVLSDFEWDPEIKGFKNADELFSTTPPRGYKVTDLTKEGEKKHD